MTEGDLCICGRSQATQVQRPGGPREAICNLTDCALPWAVIYRRPVRWYDRLIALLTGRK